MKPQIDQFIGGHEGLRILAHRLIEWQDVPGVFRWDYGKSYEKTDCGTVGCAMGLVKTFWPNVLESSSSLAEIAELYDLPAWKAISLFNRPENYGFRYYEYTKVTARMVGEKILQYLDTGEL